MNQRPEVVKPQSPLSAQELAHSDRVVYLPRLAVVIAWCAVVVGRGLSAALPGTLTGADRQIGTTLYLGAFLTQFCALTGAGLAIHLVVRLSALKRIPGVVKGAGALAALFAIGAVLLASRPLQTGLAPRALFALGMVTSSWLVWVNIPGLWAARERGLSLVVIGAGLAAAVHTLARSLGLSAAGGADVLAFQWARGVATAGFAAEWLTLLGLYLWLLRPASAAFRGVTTVVLVALAGLVYGLDASDGWRLIVSRMLEQLLLHPDPFVAPALRQFAELSALAAVPLTLVRSKRGSIGLILSLAVLGRASADVPIGGLFLTIAGLVRTLQLQSIPRSTHASPRDDG